MLSIDIISGLIGCLLTLIVLGYLIGDNPLFRAAIYIFIGVSAGYAATVICYQVLLPRLQSLQLNDPVQLAIGLIPFILGATLLAKLSPRISWMGNFAMAILVGVGAATAVGGALLGTLIPQVRASVDALDGAGSIFKMIEGMIMLAGTVLTLVYFQFGAKRAKDGAANRNPLVELFAWLGRIFISVTLGVLFAGVYMAALTAMIERLSSMIHFVKSFLGS